MLDLRVSQTTLENALRDVILQALGWRLAPVASVAALRAVPSIGQSGTTMRSNDDLIAVVSSTTTSWRWSQESTTADDGISTVKPNDVTANGRWIKWTSPVYFSTVVGGSSTTLDQITTGPLRRVIVIDKPFDEDAVVALLAGEVPAVVVEAAGDDPEDETEVGGHRYRTVYEFNVMVLAQNLRDRREATQGPTLSSDIDPGANTIDGLLRALLSGVQLTSVVEGVREVKPGPGHNWSSEYGQRRVVRQRRYSVIVSEEFPNAPNESQLVTDVMAQAHFSALDQAHDAFDPNNYLNVGMGVAVAAGLSQPVAAGVAYIAGNAVSYAGQTFAFPAYSDTYRDLQPGGAMVFASVGNGGAAPNVAPGNLRIGMTSTNGSAVVSDAILAATQQNYGPTYDIQA